jgi:hypothetical protein
MTVDVRGRRGLRTVISRRNGLPARDVGHHDWKSGNVTCRQGDWGEMCYWSRDPGEACSGED